MKIHPRHQQVQKARMELLDYLIEWSRRNNLTLAEEFALLVDSLCHGLWGAVRLERQQEEEDSQR